MRTLWVFGDSFSNRLDVVSPQYCEWVKTRSITSTPPILPYIPKTYGEIISEKLNYNLFMNATGGCDNLHIFTRIIEVLDQIQKNDIIIFGWTDTIRFRLVDKNGDWVFGQNLKDSNVSENSINEILYNRLNEKYISELNDYITFINYAFRNTGVIIIHWSWAESNSRLNELLTIPVTKLTMINDETNINDPHYGEVGHLELSQLIMKKIRAIKYI